MTHRFACRVYYEDTDLAGIVYYANYLKFIERARTEWVTAAGIDQARLTAEAGVVCAVARVAADYLRPARFGDDLEVQSIVRQLSAARAVLGQRVLREGELLFDAVVTLVALTEAGRPVRLPAEIRRLEEGGT